MPRRLLLPFALAVLLLTAALFAQEPAKPEEPKTAAPETKPPDAFHYFFGKKDKKDVKKEQPEAKSGAATMKKAEPEAVKAAPAAVPVQPKAPEAPAAAPAAEIPAAPAAVVPEAQPQPALEQPAKPAPRVDAFQYFFGKSAQPAPKAAAKEPAEKKPVDAFDYLFGKRSTATAPTEPAKESSKPPGV
ncbi:MAG TPA: hypothetical protein VGS07_06835 [Thermoanaerobaculia bacterium]|jgi:hypothetical protein|nr:hypothetical protein [Thermoanaerobaculia bacterium]